MCTLVLVHELVPGVPIVVLANRDEMLERPSLSPRLVRRDPAVFCGQDQREGGTWCGVNSHGLVVGLTNLTLRTPDPARRSRGLLCLDMLSLTSFADVQQAMKELEPHAYNPFQLVASDGVSAMRVRYDDAPELEALGRGVHATTNWPRASEGDFKRRWAEDHVAQAVAASSDLPTLLSSLRAIARTHEKGGDPRASICCHAPGYGTRSSSLIAVTASGAVRYEHADGPPCEVRFEDLSAAVAEAFAGTR